MVSGKEDAANNYARGHYTVGKEIIDLVLAFLGTDKISLRGASPFDKKVDIVLSLPAQSYDFLCSQAPAKPTWFVLALHPGSLACRFLDLSPSERLGIGPLVILSLHLGSFRLLFFLKEFDCFLSLAKVVQGLPSILFWILVIPPLHKIFSVAALLGALVENLLHLIFFLSKHHD